MGSASPPAHRSGGSGSHVFWDLSAPGSTDPVLDFFAEGAARGEQLLYVGSRPRPDLVRALAARAPGADPAGSGQLGVATREELFTPTERASAAQRARAVEELVRLALRQGWSGLCMVSEGSPLPAPRAAHDSLLGWEARCEDLVVRRPLSLLCLYDEEELADGSADDLAAVHRVVHRADHAPTPFRASRHKDVVVLSGEVDTFCAASLGRVLAATAELGPVRHVDVRDLAFLDARAARVLARWMHAQNARLDRAQPLVARLWGALGLVGTER